MNRWLRLSLALLACSPVEADWTRFRGPNGSGVTDETELPIRWSPRRGIAWRRGLPGEGRSSPIVHGDRIWLTASEDDGERRLVIALDRASGEIVWTREIEDPDPEISSAATGHAAPTPATDGNHVVAFFANAGIVAYARDGALLWRHALPAFESELGIASSPVIAGDRVFVVCDHDGDRLRTFDSFLLCLDIRTGDTVWRAERPGILRSWATPLLAPREPPSAATDLVVPAHGELRGYDPWSGEERWRVRGLTEWIAPSPVLTEKSILATSGKSGPILAVEPGGEGDVTGSRVVWRIEGEGSYVTSPVAYDGRVWIAREDGFLTCYREASGERLYRVRLDGRFTASPIAGAGRVYVTSEGGVTTVIRAGDEFEPIATNELGDDIGASLAVSVGLLYARSDGAVWAIEGAPSAVEAATRWLAREVAAWPRRDGCFSCHNSGDGYRALLAARAAGHEIEEEAISETTAWLRRPEAWASLGDGEPWHDDKLSRLQFSFALSTIETDRDEPLERAARRVAADQRDDGSWAPGSLDLVGSPTLYSEGLATYVGITILERAPTASAYRERIARGADFIASRAPRNVHEATIALLAAQEGPAPHREASLSLLREGRSRDGGWGPYVNSGPEVFDTALALLALRRLAPSLEDGARGEVDEFIAGGRRYLEREQEEDGSWIETTRPPGGESYAQRVSTTAWATMAIIATR